MASPGHPDLPIRIGVDRNGYVWRDFGDEALSMAPSNPDNEPIPGPIQWYTPSDGPDVSKAIAWGRLTDAAVMLGAAFAEFDNARDAYAESRRDA